MKPKAKLSFQSLNLNNRSPTKQEADSPLPKNQTYDRQQDLKSAMEDIDL